MSKRQNRAVVKCTSSEAGCLASNPSRLLSTQLVLSRLLKCLLPSVSHLQSEGDNDHSWYSINGSCLLSKRIQIRQIARLLGHKMHFLRVAGFDTITNFSPPGKV